MTGIIQVGRWAVAGSVRVPGVSVFKFEFSDRPDLTFAMPADEAEKFARAILEHLPPKPDRLS